MDKASEEPDNIDVLDQLSNDLEAISESFHDLLGNRLTDTLMAMLL